MTEVPTALRAHIYARDLGKCARCAGAEHCGQLTIQHRQGRGSGGTNRRSNLLTLGQACHMWVEAHPLEADAAGWSVPPGEDPAAWPIEHAGWGGRITYGDDDQIAWVS